MAIQLRLNSEMEARLQARADLAGVPKDQFLRRILDDALAPVPVSEAIALYAARAVSQGQAAALAGVSRAEFIDALGRAGVSALQYTAEEALQEAAGG